MKEEIDLDQSYLLIEVYGTPGLDCISLHLVNDQTLDEITPILLKIYDNNGWFPTGDFLYPATIGSTPWEEYGKDDPEAYETLMELMPKPEGGWEGIKRVLSWKEGETRSLIM